MAITPADLKADIVGSWFTRGVSNRRYDRARRVVRVRALNNYAVANTDFTDAIKAVISEYGYYHNEDANLPLRTTTVRRWGLTKAFVYMDYAHGYITVPTTPSSLLAAYRTTYAPVQWYRHTFGVGGGLQLGNGGTAIDGSPIPVGSPDGVLEFLTGSNGFDPAVPPRRWTWQRPAVQFHIPAVLTANPIPQVFPLMETCNSNEIFFGGNTYPAFTTRFDGVSVNAVEQDSGVIYVVNYSFTSVKSGWYNQMAYFDTANAPPGGSGQWRTRCGLAYATADYGAFP